MKYEEFEKMIYKIVNAGATPVVACNKCSYKTWMFEGSIKEAYKQFKKRCYCGFSNKILLSDFAEDLL